MAVEIRIPTPLRKFTDGQATISVEGGTITQAFENAEQAYAGLQAKIFDDSGEIRRFINVFVNGDDVRHGDGAATALKDGDEISVVPAIAGGR